MSAVFCLFLLLLLPCLQTGAAEPDVLPPQNVTMITLNTYYTLSWKWDQITAQNHNVTFTTQYLTKYKWKSKRKPRDWVTVCEKTSHTHCDLTWLNLHYLAIYMVRVQANMDGRESEWIEKEFCPDKDAAIGPPSRVDLSPAGSHLDVHICDPLSSTNTSMREPEKVQRMYYHIIYWEYSTDRQGLARRELNTTSNLVTLPDLKAWTSYCVSVQSRDDYYNKSSTFTPLRCMETEGATPAWQIALYFLISLVICFLLVLLLLYGFFRCYGTLKATFYPSIQLPTHFQEYLCDSPGSDIPRLLTPESEEALVCDEVSVFPQEALLEIHNPPAAAAEVPEPDSSGRHSRQDSGGSRDSGVYSTEGGSGPPRPTSNQTSTASQDSWQEASDPEEVKMHDMDPKTKRHGPITDEGVVDVCV